MPTITSTLLLSFSLLLCGCALSGVQQSCPATGDLPSVPPSAVPQSFSETYPSGSHTRAFKSLQSTFERSNGPIAAAFSKEARENRCFGALSSYKVIVLMAITPTGRVADAQTLVSSARFPSLEGRLNALIMSFDFGASTGSGYYTIAYPIWYLQQ
jgi:hypothetical protein